MYTKTTLFLILSWVAAHDHPLLQHGARIGFASLVFNSLDIPPKPRRYLWEICGSAVLLFNMFRIAISNPKYLSAEYLTAYVDDVPLKDFIDLETAWYANGLLLETIGFQWPNIDMFLHHLITLVLIMMGRHTSMYPLVFSVLFVTTLSNPLLNMTKLLQFYDIRYKKHTFLAFAVVFFATRVVVYPVHVLRNTLFAENMTSWLFAGNVGLAALYGMQLFWFSKIVKIISNVRH